MDKSASKARPGPPGLSIRHGPVDDQMDIDSATNGAAKRKSRSSVSQTVKYKDESDSEDEAPLVCLLFSAQESSQTTVG
jgi:DNA topoisomerase-1